MRRHLREWGGIWTGCPFTRRARGRNLDRVGLLGRGRPACAPRGDASSMKDSGPILGTEGGAARYRGEFVISAAPSSTYSHRNLCRAVLITIESSGRFSLRSCPTTARMRAVLQRIFGALGGEPPAGTKLGRLRPVSLAATSCCGQTDVLSLSYSSPPQGCPVAARDLQGRQLARQSQALWRRAWRTATRWNPLMIRLTRSCFGVCRRCMAMRKAARRLYFLAFLRRKAY